MANKSLNHGCRSNYDGKHYNSEIRQNKDRAQERPS